MADQLRWILAGLSALLLAGIFWWGARRSRQSPGNPELREAAVGPGVAPEQAPDEDDFPPPPRAHGESRDWGVPPLEPLSIRTAEFEAADFEDLPMTAQSDPLEATMDLGGAGREAAVRKFVRVPTLRMNDAVPAAVGDELAHQGLAHQGLAHQGLAHQGPARAGRDDSEPGPCATEDAPTLSPIYAHAPSATAAPSTPAPTPAFPAATAARTGPVSIVAPQPRAAAGAASPGAASGAEPPAPEANTAETQRIVGVRVCAPGEVRWPGAQLIAALEQQGLSHGRYQVFHRRHSDGRTLFCAASLVEPGTFDIARMPEDEFRGLTLFAVLPGPAEPVQTLEAMIATAAALAQALQGVVQDATGAPLTQQRAEALRDDVARFQSQLSLH